MELNSKDSEGKQRRQNDREIRKVLNEVIGNPMVVGSKGFSIIKRLWQPHNYRLYIAFDRKTFNPTEVGFDLKNYKSEHHYKELIDGCKIVVKKTQVELINLKRHNKWWHIHALKSSDIDDRIVEITDMLDAECINALREFIRLFGGKSDLEIIKRRKSEDGFKGDKFIDKIPKEMVIHDECFKKVYLEKTEIKGVHYVRNKLHNTMIENVAPQIAEEIIELNKNFNLLVWLKAQVRSIDDVFAYQSDIMRLSDQDKKEFETYLYIL